MAQNRFSIFCRRKTTERDEEGRRKGIVPKTALATSACSSSSERRNRQVVMLPSDGKRRERGRFLEASGSNDGKYPILWQTDRTHSLASASRSLGRALVIATKALEMSHLRR